MDKERKRERERERETESVCMRRSFVCSFVCVRSVVCLYACSLVDVFVCVSVRLFA